MGDDTGHERREPDAELPAPSAELILISTLTRAYLRRLPKSERRAFLKDVTDDLQWQSDVASAIRIRPSSQDTLVAAARREAAAWWARILGLMMTQLER